jgi:hypothetical protein
VETIATAPPAPGWVYVLTHPAWESVGMVKIGRTGRDPRTRAAEITSVSGLLAPCSIAWCSPVSDMAAAEKAVHRMLGTRRVRKRRELFRVDTATAQQVVEAVARSLPAPGRLSIIPVCPTSAKRSEASGRHRAPPRLGPWHHRRRHSSIASRLVIGLVSLATLIVLYTMN